MHPTGRYCAITVVRANDTDYSSADGSLHFEGMDRRAGQGPGVGMFTEYEFHWRMGGANGPAAFTTFARVSSDGSSISFEQSFPGQGLSRTAVANGTTPLEKAQLSASSQFPAFHVPKDSEEKSARGYACVRGSMASDWHFGKFQGSAAEDISSSCTGLDSGPVSIFDGDGTGAAVVISPASQFMVATAQYTPPRSGGSSGSLGWGLLGSVTSVPALFSASFVISAAPDGVNAAFGRWGSLLRKVHGKASRSESEGTKDEVLSYLGYSTDNGAFCKKT